MTTTEMFLLVILMTMLLLIIFAVGLFIGIRVGMKVSEKASAKPDSDTAPAPIQETRRMSPAEVEERKRLIEDQEAFRQLMNYNAAQAYGDVPADKRNGVGDE